MVIPKRELPSEVQPEKDHPIEQFSHQQPLSFNCSHNINHGDSEHQSVIEIVVLDLIASQ